MELVQWLYQKLNRWDDIIYKDVLDHLFDVIFQWITIQPNLELMIDYELFKLYFYQFITSNKTTLITDEYYSLQYSEDIVDLFLELKDITKSYGTTLLHEKWRTSNDLFHFIFTFINEVKELENEDDKHENIYYDYE